jgi:hypothetical protein
MKMFNFTRSDNVKCYILKFENENENTMEVGDKIYFSHIYIKAEFQALSPEFWCEMK